jgi:hypothetical protein
LLLKKLYIFLKTLFSQKKKGTLPLAATLATEEVFEAFKGAKKDALLHGHSYTAHPIGVKKIKIKT